MNMNINLHNDSPTTRRSSFLEACTSSCKKLLAGIQNIKAALLNEFRQTTFGQERLLQLALNEAEALAYETGFPLLTFPVLAREKVQAVAAWGRQQNRVRRESFERMVA
jgi:hypothetical protein